jgi:D-alanine-D-alanine ligase
MNCVMLYNKVSARDSAGDLDVLRQCTAIEGAIRTLGWHSHRVACSLNLNEAKSALLLAQPDFVFNLVESLGGTDRMMTAAPLLLESLRIPFTGSGTLAILTTTNKLRAKQMLLNHRISTPAWITESDAGWQGMMSTDLMSTEFQATNVPGVAIVKAIAEHASLGITDESVVRNAGVDELKKMIQAKSDQHQTPHFAEQYVDGREFNLSVLATDEGPLVLPPAEIEFIEFPDHKPRIVGHDAKWIDSSMESINTPRRFDFPSHDRPLLDELCAIARRCWTAFDLRGYARVDFRVDLDGQPWVLEINANPCLSPDAGFAAAVTESGLTFEDAIRHIIADALRQ